MALFTPMTMMFLRIDAIAEAWRDWAHGKTEEMRMPEDLQVKKASVLNTMAQKMAKHRRLLNLMHKNEDEK